MAGSDGLTREEERVVEQAADAIQRYEKWSQERRPGKTFTAPTADSIISTYLEEQGEPRDGDRYFELARAAAKAAWGSYGRRFARPGQAKASGRERAGFYDRYRPSGRMLDLLDRDAA